MGIAVNKSAKRVGLALGSGVARGLAHIGVLEVLEREGIPIDMISGTSMGAIIGAAYAGGKSASEIKEIALDLGWKKMLPLLDLTAPITGFIGGRRLKKRLKEIIGEVNFSDLAKPFACVAMDIVNGEEIIFRDGPVLDAVIASVSLPIIFKASRSQGRFMVDGSLVTPVPVRVLKEMGADLIISVNVLHRHGEKIPIHPEDLRREKEPNIFNMMIHVTNIITSHLVESSLTGTDILIEPNMVDIGLADFHKAQLSIRRGELAALESIADIKKLIFGQR